MKKITNLMTWLRRLGGPSLAYWLNQTAHSIYFGPDVPGHIWRNLTRAMEIHLQLYWAGRSTCVKFWCLSKTTLLPLWNHVRFFHMVICFWSKYGRGWFKSSWLCYKVTQIHFMAHYCSWWDWCFIRQLHSKDYLTLIHVLQLTSYFWSSFFHQL